VKAYEAQQAIAAGAREVDMVINVGALKASDFALVQQDVAAVVQACAPVLHVQSHHRDMLPEQRGEGCRLPAGPERWSGFCQDLNWVCPAGATIDDVALMRRVVGPTMGVKAAGGIRDLATARAMVQAGATRIGASASVKIMADAAIAS